MRTRLQLTKCLILVKTPQRYFFGVLLAHLLYVGASIRAVFSEVCDRFESKSLLVHSC